ncbi:hypothetical protein [Rhizobium sp.]|jgi:hypothetical protein|uniref:hypothetical protein n=1 Tax=Rhizobium sp. TaxID=391 RepID=UPI000E829DE8|nr:hypothetical protein [Rhizobium sp.]
MVISARRSICFAVPEWVFKEDAMCDQVDKYDLPPSNNNLVRPLAKQLVGKKGRQLYFASIVIIAVGLIHAFLSGDKTILPRYGALVTTSAIAQSWRQLRWARMVPDITSVLYAVYSKIEHNKLGPDASEDVAKSRAYKGVNRVLPSFYEAVQFEFLEQNLIVAAVGNFIWAFGDLVPLTPSLT